MRWIALGLAWLALLTTPVSAQNTTRLIISNNVKWTFTAFALNGASQTLIAAQTPGTSNSTGFIVVNPTGNATVYVDISGGTATTARGIPVAAGTMLSFQGQSGPYNAVTVIGTNAQTLELYTGQRICGSSGR